MPRRLPTSVAAAPMARGGTTFDRCYLAHRDMVFRVCLRYCAGDRARAEDLTHDVFVRLLENLERLDETEDLGGWLYRVAANLAVSGWRKERSFVSWLLRTRQSGEDASEPTTPGARMARSQLADRVLSTLRALPDRERVVLCMKLLDGRSQRDIAVTLGMSEGYVSKLVARAVSRVRAAGWEVSDGGA